MGRSAEEMQPFYAEFSRILQMFDQAKTQGDSKSWTIIYEKLSEFQNELKQSEHYLALCEFSLQQQVFTGPNDSSAADLKQKVKRLQHEVNNRDQTITELVTKLQEFENSAKEEPVEDDPVKENRRLRVLVSQLQSKNESLKQVLSSNRKRTEELSQQYHAQLEQMRTAYSTRRGQVSEDLKESEDTRGSELGRKASNNAERESNAMNASSSSIVVHSQPEGLVLSEDLLTS